MAHAHEIYHATLYLSLLLKIGCRFFRASYVIIRVHDEYLGIHLRYLENGM